MEGKPPRTIAGVALYFVSKQYRRSDRDALSRIAEAVGVTENTIIRNA
jgi:transcription initiation factor TFIIIB Brf1 subunit/transcription initiation factor TFIIB